MKKTKAPDWANKEELAERSASSVRPVGAVGPIGVPYDPDGDAYKEFLNPTETPFQAAMKSIETGAATVESATLFMGRFNQAGQLCREAPARGLPPYQVLRVNGQQQYAEAMRHADKAFSKLDRRIKREAEKRAMLRKVRKEAGGYFQSNSDLGSLYSYDPNQYTEFTPMFNGPYYRQQYFDYFKAISRAFEESNHSPWASRVVNILRQYAYSRGFKIRCKNKKLNKNWIEYEQEFKILLKMRKFWPREMIVCGELMLDKKRMVSIDSSTIYDIICEGYGEYVDDVLYYQQMFQTATQMYSGQKVPGVRGSAQSKAGTWIIRQIPFNQVIHVKSNVFSNEKRGRPVIFPILGWLKRLKDLYNAQVLGEQFRASFVFDDEVDGTPDQVAAHAARYAYIPPGPSIFAHNKAIQRKPLAPMAGVTGNGSANIGNEISCIAAMAIGIPKEHFNIMAAGGGSRATALVGSEPFTKVIEDFQQDGQEIVEEIEREFCRQMGAEYVEEDWESIWPSVSKDSASDVLKNIALAEEQRWISKRRAGTMAAAELEADNYEFDEEQSEIKEEEDAGLNAAVSAPVPGGRFGPPKSQASPIHGDGKQELKDQLNTL